MKLGNSAFEENELIQRTLHMRACEAVIWGMPAVNFDLLYQAAVKIGAGFNQVVFWSRLPDWRNQTLTPNPDTLYFMPFFNTMDEGPIVLEIPAADGGSITGSLDDCWQTAVEDIGPAGVDKGKGGKYLILPPGYKSPVPDGYFPMLSSTYQSYALLRSNPASGSDADVADAVAYGRQIKVYPLSQASSTYHTVFVDASNDIYDNTIPYDLRFFESLNRIVQMEPWLERDKAMIDTLKCIGIEKGKPFSPDKRMESILIEAATETRAYLNVLYEKFFEPSFDADARWAVPVSKELLEGLQSNYTQPDSYPVEARGVTYAYGFFSAKHLGQGQFYLMTIKDKEGLGLEGGYTYRLHVPSNPPVRLYWSATAYDRDTHALIRNMEWASRSSNTPGLQKNADGSVDIYFGAEPPQGKEANWVPTDPGGRFEILFRLYGPEKALFDKTWKLLDIEKIAERSKSGVGAEEKGMQTAKHSSSSKVPVTVDNFIRAETDKYFATAVQEAGKIGGFKHYRDFMPISNQTVIRANLDTLYSAAVFDLDAGPVTITLPNAGPRFMSLMVIDEDHYVPQVAYGEGTYTFSKETIGTRYMMAAIRTLADPNDLDDLSEVHSLQDRTKIRQANPGNFEIPPWDMESQKKIRDILLNLGEAMPDSRNMFGARGQVDPVRHLIGTAMAWGGNPEKDAVYINVTPDKNDGKTAYRLRVKDVPVDAFWSISVYNAEGYFQTNLNNAYTINNLTGKKEQDGSVGIQFGNCDGNTPNCLPIMPGWNYMVRLYRPRNEVLDGSWCFPSAQPIG